MDGARELFIRSVLNLLSFGSILVWIHNLADPEHPDFIDTLPPHLWGMMNHRCVRCGVKSHGHVTGGWACNLLRAAEAFWGEYIILICCKLNLKYNLFDCVHFYVQ